MKPLYLLLLLAVALIACNASPTPTPIEQRPIESFLDPALKGEDRDVFLQALRLLHPAARDSLSFVDTTVGRVYSSSERARSATALYRQVEGSVYQTSTGETGVFPSDTPVPRFDGLQLQETFDQLKPCQSDANGDESGPFRRILRKPGKINWMTAKVRLPTGVTLASPNAEAGGFKQRLRLTNGSTVTLNNGPFIYAGGWGADGTRHMKTQLQRCDPIFQQLVDGRFLSVQMALA